MKKEIVIALGMFGILNSFSIGADITYYGLNSSNFSQFQDISNKGSTYWAASAVYEMTSLSVMNGFSTSVFSPDSDVTNEQAVTIVLNALGKAKDVQKLNGISNTWSDKYIKYAMGEGLITEKIVMKKADISKNIEAMKDKGVFVRDYPITREEMAALICRAFSLKTKEEDRIEFYDKTQISDEYKTYVDAVSSNKIMVGTDDKMFQPKSNLKRAEMAQIFQNCESLLLDGLAVVKKQGFVDSISDSTILSTDSDGNEVAIDVASKNVPVFRAGKLAGKESLRVSDEIEYFIASDKTVRFIRVIDEGIDGTLDAENSQSFSKQGIVVGNSPYFYQISIKDKLGETESYSYGDWTNVWKDGKAATASEILQGDTVYLEFDAIGDLVAIRGITNTVITYGTITDIANKTLTVEDENYESKQYNVYKIPIYKNGEEVALSTLHTGEYAKVYSSASELIKIEIVTDQRTVYHIYKGYISDVNQVQDRIILRDTNIYKDYKWTSLAESYISIPTDEEMLIHYDGETIAKSEFGEKQVGKFAYVITREDTQELEKVKAISIDGFVKEVTGHGEFRSYNSSSKQLRIYDDNNRYEITEDTLFVIDGKSVKVPNFESGDMVSVTAVYENGEYLAKLVVVTENDEKIDEEPMIYSGTIRNIGEEEEVALRVSERFDGEEWYSLKNKVTNFVITENTRIFSEAGPINIREFSDEEENGYSGSKAVVVAVGDEIVALSMVDLGETPYILRGVVNRIKENGFEVSDTEYFDFEEEEWLGHKKATIVLNESAFVVKNGKYSRQKDIEKGQEVLIFQKDNTTEASFVIISD